MLVFCQQQTVMKIIVTKPSPPPLLTTTKNASVYLHIHIHEKKKKKKKKTNSRRKRRKEKSKEKKQKLCAQAASHEKLAGFVCLHGFVHLVFLLFLFARKLLLLLPHY
jgi:Flp pilus assembly protein TadB